MAQSERFIIGAVVDCTDGICGRVTRAVVDPLARAVTHLAVEPQHRQGLARLVPIDLATATADGVSLACTIAEFEHLDSAEETQFIPGTRGYEVYGPEQVLSWPYYRLGDTVMTTENMGKVSDTITFDTIPLGEVAIRRGDQVRALDGPIGHVHGLVIDPGTDHVSHVLLAEGHLWGRKQVAIPIVAVTGVDDEISLNLTKQQVQDLPPVDISV